MNDQTIDFSIFEQVDIRVGRISSVETAEGFREPAYKLTIDFGTELGTRRSISQATNYSPQSLLGRQVLAVFNLKPRQVGKHISEVPVLGVPTEDRGTSLIVPEMEATMGGAGSFDLVISHTLGKISRRLPGRQRGRPRAGGPEPRVPTRNSIHRLQE
jgi:tRNA-binding protein